jgi:2-polyprenyl-3-methyl-5-hydroxy-6-metoxy-1,4-benzoquinol methylase
LEKIDGFKLFYGKRMGLIKLQSTNPKFSFLIRKNPSRGLIVKPHRQGLLYGYFPVSDQGQYLVYFRDRFNQLSYKATPDAQFEYLDALRYTSPEIPLHVIRECFRTVYTVHQEDDCEGFEHVFTALAVKIDANRERLERFTRYFDGLEVELKPIAAKTHQLVIKTGSSIYRLLNFANLLFTFIASTNNDHFEIHESQLENQLRSAGVLDADYYIRYLLNSKMVRNREVFNRVKPLLEQSQRHRLEMVYGNTAEQRREFIRSLLSFNCDIVDIGCGEGAYAIPFAKKLRSSREQPPPQYYALDIDEACLKALKRRAERSELNHLRIFGDFDELTKDLASDRRCDVIVTEVVEHMERAEGQRLIKRILREINWGKIILTTPNFEFNQFYLMDHKFRHDDHTWEATRQEFKVYLEEVLSDPEVSLDPSTYGLSYLEIGDRVDSIPVTQGAFLVRDKIQSTKFQG